MTRCGSQAMCDKLMGIVDNLMEERDNLSGRLAQLQNLTPTRVRTRTLNLQAMDGTTVAQLFTLTLTLTLIDREARPA